MMKWNIVVIITGGPVSTSRRHRWLVTSLTRGRSWSTRLDRSCICTIDNTGAVVDVTRSFDLVFRPDRRGRLVLGFPVLILERGLDVHRMIQRCDIGHIHVDLGTT